MVVICIQEAGAGGSGVQGHSKTLPQNSKKNKKIKKNGPDRVVQQVKTTASQAS